MGPDLRRRKTEVALLIVQACSLGNKGNYTEAQATITRALELSPDDDVLLFHRERLAEPAKLS